MQPEAPRTSSIPTNQLGFCRDLWPRFSVDEERIELFADLLRAGEELPPIEVVAHSDGKYLIADGVHRSVAAIRVGHSDVRAVIVTPLQGETSETCVYRRALETATRSALPLSRAERRHAVLKLAKETKLSDRAMARLVGVSHNSVGRWTRQEGSDDAASSRAPSSPPSLDRIAARLASYLIQLDDGQGLRDPLTPQRVGQHLARAFADRHGTSALEELTRFGLWIDSAAAALREAGYE